MGETKIGRIYLFGTLPRRRCEAGRCELLNSAPQYGAPRCDSGLCGRARIFYVSDNGIGIKEKHLQDVFQIFRRPLGQGEYGGGTGAGLTITRKIVERYGGRIWLESVFGEGSTCCVTREPEPEVSVAA